MDLNNRLIEAVRQCPLLYKNNASLSDRKCGWQQIAQQMKMQEALLKSRWHFLREHYKRNALAENQMATNHFPYKKEMEFLLPYLRPPPREEPENKEMLPISIIKPEFVITQKDLESDSGNEEYVFLEVEALGTEYETNNEATQQINDSELRKQLQQEPQKEHEQQQEEDESDENGQIEVEVHIKQEKTENHQRHSENQNNSEQLKKESEELEEVTCNKNGTKEDEDVRTQIQEASEEKVETKVEVRESDSSSDNIGAESVAIENSSSNERSEDTIFGELVSAMLKKMPAEKKRAIKRDIMNLLLT
ncbi:chromo domain-containing protein cec-1-like [Anastrepha ludens]|uniref:chromo domain-containing protein cec-1-like n=1 Tax=Anastrepha ludens TaxID=28586 RepID=UPI0023B1D65E|nr:chromo domain-containing protein cec-1-like [Anastrepha ludens]